MAWPCISRVCCLARFWNQFDKSDLSVPLTIQNYSDIADQEIRSVTKHVPADRPQRNDYVAAQHRSSPTSQDATGRRAEASYKPREDFYQPPGVPFPSVTQYKQDYKPWPIPKKDNFPWIGNGGGKGGSVADSPSNASAPQPNQSRAGKEERASRQRHAEQAAAGASTTSSYRQEYRPWAGVRPAKPVQKRPTFLGTATSEPPPETSYQAAFSTDSHRQLEVSAPDAGVSTQSSGQLERAERPEGSRPEEQLVRTKLSPNPSAVFQSGSRIFNI